MMRANRSSARVIRWASMALDKAIRTLDFVAEFLEI